jgi:hypothetical protein
MLDVFMKHLACEWKADLVPIAFEWKRSSTHGPDPSRVNCSERNALGTAYQPVTWLLPGIFFNSSRSSPPPGYQLLSLCHDFSSFEGAAKPRDDARCWRIGIGRRFRGRGGADDRLEACPTGFEFDIFGAWGI